MRRCMNQVDGMLVVLFGLLHFRSHRDKKRTQISDQAVRRPWTKCTSLYQWSRLPVLLLALLLLKPLEDEIFGGMKM